MDKCNGFQYKITDMAKRPGTQHIQGAWTTEYRRRVAEYEKKLRKEHPEFYRDEL